MGGEDGRRGGGGRKGGRPQMEALTVRYTASAASRNDVTTFCFFSLNFSKMPAKIYKQDISDNEIFHIIRATGVNERTVAA